MPSRWFSLAIVLFWLGMSAFLFYKEIWPQLQPDAPPPFNIDLVDEARTEQNQIRWLIYPEGTRRNAATPIAKTDVKHNEKACFKLTDMSQGALRMAGVSDTALAKLNGMNNMPFSRGRFLETLARNLNANELEQYQEQILHRTEEKYDDSFTFSMQLNCANLPQHQDGMALGSLKLRTYNGVYRINRAGQLLAMEVDLRFKFLLLSIDAHFEGEVIDNVFHSRCRAQVSSPFSKDKEVESDLEPVPVSRRGTVLIPTHPVNRIKGLRRGQHWRMPLVDPLADAVAATSPFGTKAKRFLDVRVLPETKLLPDNDQAIPCLVIEYDDEDTQPRTWVQESTGLVLRQEINVMTMRLIMHRETISQEP